MQRCSMTSNGRANHCLLTPRGLPADLCNDTAPVDAQTSPLACGWGDVAPRDWSVPPKPPPVAAVVRTTTGGLADDAAVEVLSSRILLRPTDLARSHAFYGDVLGLAVYREFGPPDHRGVVYFLGNGMLEVSGRAAQPPAGLELWLQVRNAAGEHARLADAGVTVTQPPRREPWGLVEMWIEDPDGVRIAVVEVPEDHPLRRDQR
jgi:predicted enzyme related to lactoylglutathione lyase